MEDIKSIIAKNISELRVSHSMTQLELAEKLHYSDKAVSKWERGESAPEIATLKAIAELFEVSVDYLVQSEHKKEETAALEVGAYIANKRKVKKHSIITAMSILLVWFVFTFIYVVIDVASPSAHAHWLCFIYAVPVFAIVWLVFNSIWFNRRRNYLIISLLTWSALVSIHLSVLAFGANIWQIYILGIPGQIVILLWSLMRTGKKQTQV